MPPRPLTRGEAAINWVETFCTSPGGRAVRLTAEQRRIIYQWYDAEQDVAVRPPLASYLSLLHLLGPESHPGTAPPPFPTTIFELWAAASPVLRQFLRRDGETIVCDQRGTAWSRPATA